ncbi:MAG: hypothetical protein RQ842_02085 [Vulcanisaeta sp.]|nr:hypothetical protein [Vulcanisaeta sp.]
MGTNNLWREIHILNKRANGLITEWVRVRARRPTTAVERTRIAKHAQELLRWVETDLQLLAHEDRMSDRDILEAINTLYELHERLKRVINEVY